MEFPEPVINVAIEPRQSRSGEDGRCTTETCRGRPTFRVSTNHETGQTIIAGMGELHLK